MMLKLSLSSSTRIRLLPTPTDIFQICLFHYFNPFSFLSYHPRNAHVCSLISSATAKFVYIFLSLNINLFCIPSVYIQFVKTLLASLVRKLSCLNVLHSAYSKNGFKYGVEQFDLKQHSLIVSPNTVSSNLIIKVLLNCRSQVMRFSCLIKNEWPIFAQNMRSKGHELNCS